MSTISQSRQNLDERTLTAMVALILLGVLLVLDVAAWLGRLPDTRDPEYSLGRVTAPWTASGAKSR
jgi:hypothetical protein